jgi:hypothetical protein
MQYPVPSLLLLLLLYYLWCFLLPIRTRLLFLWSSQLLLLLGLMGRAVLLLSLLRQNAFLAFLLLLLLFLFLVFSMLP